jgi:hypothetical protein
MSVEKLLQLRDEYTQLYVRSQKCAMWRQLYREKYIDPSEWDSNHQFEIDENIRYSEKCECFLSSIYEALENKNKKYYNIDITIGLDDKNNIITIFIVFNFFIQKLFENKKMFQSNNDDEFSSSFNGKKMVDLQNQPIDGNQKISQYLIYSYRAKAIKQIMFFKKNS